MATISVTLGESFMMTGLSVTAFTAAHTLAAASGEVPKAMPPPWTLGQLMFTSSQPTSGRAPKAWAKVAYSSREYPEMLAMTGFPKLAGSAIQGSSSARTASMPGFWSPTEFSMPQGVSAMRGVGLPTRGSVVVPLKEKLPSIRMS